MDMTSNYKRGLRLEHRVRRLLEELGWRAFRLAGSKPFDLIAIRRGRRPLLVECRGGAHPYVPRDRAERLLTLAEEVDATPLVAIRRGRRLKLATLGEGGLNPISLEDLARNP